MPSNSVSDQVSIQVRRQVKVILAVDVIQLLLVVAVILTQTVE